MKSAVFCGSFNPFTLGHLDILKKAGEVFDKIYVAVPLNTEKTSKISPAARIKIARLSVKDCSFAEVASFSGLLTDFCKAVEARHLVRGLRNSADFEYENELLRNYKTQYPEIECSYFMASGEVSHISSSFAREIAGLGGDLRSYVTKDCIELVKEAYK